MTIPILTTKLYIPPVRAELVPRPRLIELLDQGRRAPAGVTLVSAPPGFGKTTLVSAWLAGRPEEAGGKGAGPQPFRADSSGSSPAGGPGPETGPTFTPAPRRSPSPARSAAWVSLDEQDNDPIRFWTYVATALEPVRAGIGAAAMALLQAPEPQPVETTLTTLINAVSTIARPFSLVLDDYHLIDRPAIHQAVTFLLENMPPQMRVVIISRSEPPLPLTRFRVRNRLHELRESDLRFTPEEAAAFLNQTMGLALDPADIAALETRTEGWIAGLQLAALSMQGRDDAHSFVRAFTGSHRYIIDYLAEEVLAQQPPPVREFLLKTSILDRLHGPLCDALLSRPGGAPRGGNPARAGNGGAAAQARGEPEKQPLQEISSGTEAPFEPASRPETAAWPAGQKTLEYLDQANLFLIPLDDERRWYRYHHLFADFLQEHLRQTAAAEEIAALHRQASLWHMANELPTEAVNHALAAGDIDRVVHLIEQMSVELLTLGEAVTLLTWLEALPPETVRFRPRLSLNRAWANLILGLWTEVEPPLIEAEAGLTAHEQAGAAGRRIPAGADARGMWGEAAALRAMILSEQGQVEQAIALSEQALTRLPAESLLARSVIKMHLGSDYAAAGDLEKAKRSLAESIAAARKIGNIITVLSASGMLAEIQQSQGRLAAAAVTHRQALTYVETYTRDRRYSGLSLPMAGRSYVGLAEIRRKQNDLAGAMTYLTTGLELGRQGDINGALHVGHIVLAQIRQGQGDLAGALTAIEQAGQFSQDIAPTFEWAAAVRARVWLAQGNLAAAGEWAENCGLPLDDDFNYGRFPGEYATLVRVYIAQEQFEAALQLLARMRAVEESYRRAGRLLEILMLQALALYAQGHDEQALLPLEQALAIAEKSGYIRLLLDEGPPLAGLLRLAAERGLAPHFIDKLLAAAGSGAYSSEESSPVRRGPEAKSPSASPPPRFAALIEPLTDRELEVLAHIAEGLSNREIAAALIIAEGTVKKHIHNIFGKLNVRRRTQVVLRARELGLLAD